MLVLDCYTKNIYLKNQLIGYVDKDGNMYVYRKLIGYLEENGDILVNEQKVWLYR